MTPFTPRQYQIVIAAIELTFAKYPAVKAHVASGRGGSPAHRPGLRQRRAIFDRCRLLDRRNHAGPAARIRRTEPGRRIRTDAAAMARAPRRKSGALTDEAGASVPAFFRLALWMDPC